MAKPGRRSHGCCVGTSLAPLAPLSSESFGTHPILFLPVITKSYDSQRRNVAEREQPKGTGEQSIVPWRAGHTQGPGPGTREWGLGFKKQHLEILC